MRSLARAALAFLALVPLAARLAAQEIPGHRPAETVPAASQPTSLGAPSDAGVRMAPSGGAPGPGAQDQRWHSNLELGLTLGVLVFGSFVLLLLGWFLVKGILPADGFLKLFVLVIVVTAGLFVVVAGYTQDQIAPMMGLLGTLVGYLLGRDASRVAAKAAETPA